MDARAIRLARRLIGTSVMLSFMFLSSLPAIAAEDEPASVQSTKSTKPASSKASRSERAKVFGEKTFDVIVLRPLQSAAVVGGTALFVPAAVMSSPGGLPLIEEAWDYFVVVRYEDAWSRPLGDY